MERFVCIHGHFYQPPRENPWLEDIELQDSAAPYHNWNERINQECYGQNAVSRILDDERQIVNIVNNYSHMSFNFGPTLLYWLESHAPDVYQKILEADRVGQQRFSGHGCALAQPYNHMILPLSNVQDMHTQIIWGVQDFRQRFQREPEGMWLPETAVNMTTLEVLAFHKMQFTILSPVQAKRIRKIGGRRWKQVNEHTVDTSIPYLCNLPSGKQIVIFFYHGAIAHEVAYGGLLHSGEGFAQRLMSGFPSDDNGQHRLVHIATDGESFGHHHRHGDMALAYCLHQIDTEDSAQVTIYGEYLEKQPPEYEVEIVDNSSWSCAHGVERWKSNCGCSGNAAFVGQQGWRGPLREGLDWLRYEFAQVFEQKMAEFCSDPWHLRNQYIDVINDRSPDAIHALFEPCTDVTLNLSDKVICLKLLEMQRCAMLMYTSCGWFFDHISGIETVQIMQYAARAMQLYEEISGIDLEFQFKSRLEAAPGNHRPYHTGKEVYESCVEPFRVDLSRVGAHVALSAVFDEAFQKTNDIYCYTIHMDQCTRVEAGIQVLIAGIATLESRITLEQYTIEIVVLYLGDHHLFGAVRAWVQDSDFETLHTQLQDALQCGETNEAMRIINTSFGGKSYSLSHLFKDQQRHILDHLLEGTRQEIEGTFRHIYEHNVAIMRIIRNLDMPLPEALAGPAKLVLEESILRELRAEQLDLEALRKCVHEVSSLSIQLNAKQLTFEASQRLGEWMKALREQPKDIKQLEKAAQALEILIVLVPDIDLQTAQNTFFKITQTDYPTQKEKAESGDPSAVQWLDRFKQLATHLKLAIP
jgi:alpha-amylase/alpha-mannosidase (GH57 family)